MARRAVASIGLGLLALTLSLSAAEESGPWTDYPGREVERPPLAADRGFAVDLTVNSISTRQYFDQDGEIKDLDLPSSYFSLNLDLGYGITDRWEIMLRVPYLAGRSEDVSGGALGDMAAGSRVAIILSPAFDLAAGIIVSVPTGISNYDYELVGSSVQLENFRTGDPSYNYYPGLELRSHGQDWSWRLDATYIITSPGEVDYNRVGGSKRTVDCDPGDGYRIQTGFYYQAGERWVPGLFLNYSSITENRIEDKGQDDATMLIELQPRLLIQISPDLDAVIAAGYALAGKNELAGYPVLVELKSRF